MAENAAKPVKKNILALLVGVLFRPRKTFDDLKDNHKRAWWFPAILILLLTVAPLLVAQQPASVPDPSFEKGEVQITVDPRMVESGGEMPVVTSSSGPNLLALGGALLGTPAAWLLWGGSLYLASVFLGRSSSFGQMFRLVVWTWLPYGIRSLVQTVYILLTGTTIVNKGLSGFVMDQSVTSVIPSGPGQLALASILGRVDIYMIWHVLLVSVGLMAFTNLKRRKALIAVLAIWIVFALLGIIPAIFGGMLGSIGGGTVGGGYG